MRSYSFGLVAALLASEMVKGEPIDRELFKRRLDEAEPNLTTESRYVGVDYGHKSGFTATMLDQSRLEAAKAKRARKALKLSPAKPADGAT